LIGPTWFRRLTTALATGVVDGSILVHADGVDYRVLKPTWLAIALFVALPAAFGWLIGPVADRVRRPDSWTRVGRRQWALPFAALVLFPFAAIPVLLAIGVISLLVALSESDSVSPCWAWSRWSRTSPRSDESSDRHVERAALPCSACPSS